MRRANGLFDRVSDHENLRRAFAQASVGKRDRPEVRQFADELDVRLAAIAEALRSGSVQVGDFRQFVIHDPKRRIITAPCFTERVLHHALMNVCEPVFERWLIDESYACRRGKGRLAALARAQRHARRHPAYLQLDIRQYFDSVPHELLLTRLARLFREPALLGLLTKIVRGFRGKVGRGLPIGALTSQHLANCYLGAFDRYVKQELRPGGYVRYMDDMLIWGESTAELRDLSQQCASFLSAELHLETKPEPCINWSHHGVTFLGCRVYATHLELSRRSKLRFRRRLLAVDAGFRAGTLSESALQQRTQSLVAFTIAGDVKSWRWRTRVIGSLPVSGH